MKINILRSDGVFEKSPRSPNLIEEKSNERRFLDKEIEADGSCEDFEDMINNSTILY